jgi:hypothetical protein
VFLLSDEQIDRIIGYRHPVMLGAMGWAALMSLLPRAFSVGLLTAFMLIFAGAICGGLEQWRSEPGLWILATFFAVLCGLGYAFFEFIEIEAFLNIPQVLPLRWGGILLACDVAIGLIVLSKILCFAISIAVRNWQLTHEPESFDE